MIRANALLPAARFGLREEMKQAYGFGWREHVRGVTTTLDVVENLSFHERIRRSSPSSTRNIRARSMPATRSIQQSRCPACRAQACPT